MTTRAAKNMPVLPGKHEKTVFLMNKKVGYSFLLEKIDADVFELSILTYGDNGNEKPMSRTEHVLHCDHASLIDLKAAINHIVK
jgi:hypothetical protein